MCDSATQSAVGMRQVHPYARKHGHHKVMCLFQDTCLQMQAVSQPEYFIAVISAVRGL
jgi:hypothetical protein